MHNEAAFHICSCSTSLCEAGADGCEKPRFFSGKISGWQVVHILFYVTIPASFLASGKELARNAIKLHCYCRSSIGFFFRKMKTAIVQNIPSRPSLLALVGVDNSHHHPGKPKL